MLSEPLAGAVAGVLAMAAYERRQVSLGGVMGESNAVIALALSVLEVAGESPPAPAEPRRRR